MGGNIFLQSNSGIVAGIDGKMVKVETFIGSGLPSFSIIGLPDVIVRESRERIRSSLKTFGISLPPKRIVINLSPADLRKTGSHFDLPIAYNLLKLLDEEKNNCKEENVALVGELSLNGKIVAIKGILSLIDSFKINEVDKIIIPFDNYEEASLIKNLEIIPLRDIGELIYYVKSGNYEKPDIKSNKSYKLKKNFEYLEVVGQEIAKRGLTIAIAGKHNILFIGTPGVGKSMIAKGIPSILHELSYEESIQVSKIASLVDNDGIDIVKNRKRPFRCPHHSITKSALVGGGFKPSPGEISLAHNGVLFLDEILEFEKDSLDLLREPLEEKTISISRINGSVKYPADFLLVAAMNPCKCGYYGSSRKSCICKNADIKRYLKKISGPILDRIPILIKMNEIEIENINSRIGKSTEAIKNSIEKARKIQIERYKNSSIKYNGDLNNYDIEYYCALSNSAKKTLDLGYKKLNLSLRSYNNVIKVARTIADLENSDLILENHVLEAIQFRKMEEFIMG